MGWTRLNHAACWGSGIEHVISALEENAPEDNEHVAVFWGLNDVLAGRGKVVRELDRQFWRRLSRMTTLLKLRSAATVTVGGTAAMWNLPEAVNGHAEAIVDFITRRGIPAFRGAPLAGVELADTYHAKASAQNARIFASYFVHLIDFSAALAEHSGTLEQLRRNKLPGLNLNS